jgi:hypothetical protein
VKKDEARRRRTTQPDTSRPTSVPTALAASLAVLPLAATIAPLAWYARMSRHTEAA